MNEQPADPLFSGKYLHCTYAKGSGAVAAAYAGDPRAADSQIYVVLAPQPQLNRGYTVFGQVISGMDVVNKLRVTDVIRRATIKAPAK